MLSKFNVNLCKRRREENRSEDVKNKVHREVEVWTGDWQMTRSLTNFPSYIAVRYLSTKTNNCFLILSRFRVMLRLSILQRLKDINSTACFRAILMPWFYNAECSFVNLNIDYSAPIHLVLLFRSYLKWHKVFPPRKFTLMTCIGEWIPYPAKWR